MSEENNLHKEPSYLEYRGKYKGILAWIWSTDHKRIGLLYLYSVMTMFLLGMTLGFLMKLELISPGRQIMDAQSYNAFFTVLIPYTSMHGSTTKMVEHLVDALGSRGVAAVPFNLAVTDLGAYAIRLVDAATVVFGTPTVLVGPHPNVVLAAALTAALRPKLRHAAVIGSYGWAGKAPETVQALASGLAAEWLPSVFARGLPTDETFAGLDRLAEAIAERHRGLS